MDGNLSIDPASSCRCQLRSIQPFTFPRFGFVRVLSFLEPQMRHFSRSFRGSAFKKARATSRSQNRLQMIHASELEGTGMSRCRMARGNFAGARYELDEFHVYQIPTKNPKISVLPKNRTRVNHAARPGPPACATARPRSLAQVPNLRAVKRALALAMNLPS